MTVSAILSHTGLVDLILWMFLQRWGFGLNNFWSTVDLVLDGGTVPAVLTLNFFKVLFRDTVHVKKENKLGIR